jgi:hypothetical protein
MILGTVVGSSVAVRYSSGLDRARELLSFTLAEILIKNHCYISQEWPTPVLNDNRVWTNYYQLIVFHCSKRFEFFLEMGMELNIELLFDAFELKVEITHKLGDDRSS